MSPFLSTFGRAFALSHNQLHSIRPIFGYDVIAPYGALKVIAPAMTTMSIASQRRESNINDRCWSLISPARGVVTIFPPQTYPRNDAYEAWRFAWLSSGMDPPA